MWINITGGWFPRAPLENRIQRLSQEFKEHFEIYKDKTTSSYLKGKYWGIWIDGNPLLSNEGKQIVFRRKRSCESWLENMFFPGPGSRRLGKAYKEAIQEMIDRGTIVYEKRDVKDFDFPIQSY